jgi:hypothetical protein
MNPQILSIAMFVALLSITSISAECVKKSSKELKTFIIDLDKPARERFAETSAYFKDQINQLIAAEKFIFKLMNHNLIFNVENKNYSYFMKSIVEY